MTHTWSNWSASVTCTPQRIATPASEAALIALVRQAGQNQQTVRVVGSGHSFTPLCATDGLLISLDGLQGLLHNEATPRVESTHKKPLHPNQRLTTPAHRPPTIEYASVLKDSGHLQSVWAGTKLYALGDPLWERRLALANMGDIDRQALAGAISTGTHGTGRSLGSLSTQVAGLRLVLASGELLDCSPTQEPELFKAAQVSLGALGVVSQVTLRCLPAYYLHERTWVAPFDQCLAELDQHIQANRHFEFFWVPEFDACAMKTLNPVDEHKPGLFTTEGEAAGRLARYVRAERIDRSYRIFPSERTLKFNEIEFAVAAEYGSSCLGELRELMQRRYPTVVWPIEYRTLAADDLWLSPAYGRETVTISLHQAAELSYQPFFAEAEAIFRNHQGRPHWGKIHTHTARELTQLYPQWERFQTVRQRLDPDGRFLNDYLRRLLVSN
jgi:FAD/FMN-containing dehydrogenase